MVNNDRSKKKRFEVARKSIKHGSAGFYEDYTTNSNVKIDNLIVCLMTNYRAAVKHF